MDASKSGLNRRIKVPSFQTEGIPKVKKRIQRDAWLTTVDLKDGYFHLKLHPESRKLVGVKWRGKFFKCKVLHWGRSCVPFLFTEVMKPIAGCLWRDHQVLTNWYLDDALIFGKSQEDSDAKTCTGLGLLG